MDSDTNNFFAGCSTIIRVYDNASDSKVGPEVATHGRCKRRSRSRHSEPLSTRLPTRPRGVSCNVFSFSFDYYADPEGLYPN